MMWPIWQNIEGIVEVTLANRERIHKRHRPQFQYASGAHKRVCDKVYGARLQIVRDDQIVDVLDAAIRWEEQVMTRVDSEAAWSFWREVA